MSYNAKVYRAQGAAELVITSSGTLTMGGTMASTGTLNISGTGNVASGGTLNVASGGTFAMATGSAVTLPVQTAATSATVITNYGITNVTGTTAGPSFQIAAPAAGVFKFISLTATSSGVTHRAILVAPTTTVTFSGIAGDEGNTLTLASSAMHNVAMVGLSATAYRIVGVYTSTHGGLSATS